MRANRRLVSRGPLAASALAAALLCHCSLLFNANKLDDGSNADASAGETPDGPGGSQPDGPATGGDDTGGGSVGDAPSGGQDQSSGGGPDATGGLGPDAGDSAAKDGAREANPPGDASPDSTVDSGPDAPAPADAGADTAPAADAGDAGSPCDPTKPFAAPVLLTSLQSAGRDGDLRLLPDELTGFFWSSRGDAGSPDLYTTTRADTMSAFGNVSLLNNVNSGSYQYDPTVTADGLTLAFRSSRDGGAGGDDLYWASRASTGGDFAGVAPIAGVNSSSSDVQPFLIPSGTEIYFSSNRTGDYDIYRATGSGGTFAAPTAVSEVNMTGVVDQNPAVSADDLTILFSSDRTGGMGARDIWIATRSSTSATFGTPTDLAGVNTAGSDYPGWLSPDGCRLYLHSDVSGSSHIYLATRPP